MFNFKTRYNKEMKSLYKIIRVMLIISLIKVLLLYSFTHEKNIVVAFLRTVPWILLFYSPLIFLKQKKLKIFSFFIHALVGIILFVDLVYYQYYGFLPSVTMLLFVGNVPTVWKSIFFILRPIYFAMILDLIPIGILLNKEYINYSLFNSKHKKLFKIIIPLLIIILILPIIYIKGNTTYAYNNYGIFTYHIYDAYTQITNKEEDVIAEEEINNEVEKITNNDKNEEEPHKKYEGIAEGKNIIVVQFESLQNFLINDEYNGQILTPNLNKFMTKDSIYFNNFYQQVGPGNTSDAEFVSHTSLYPTNNLSIFNHYNENYYYTFPKILKNKGYSTYSFHGNNEDFWGRNKMYPKLGIDNFISLEDFDYDEKEDIIDLGLNDMDFYKQTVGYLKEAPKPFYSMVISITSHHPYDMPEELRNIELKEEHEGTIFGNYIQSINYADRAFGEFIEGLKKEGLYEDSIIVVYGDHAGLYPARAENEKIMTEYLGKEYRFDEFMNIPLIFHIPGFQMKETNEIVGGEIDLFPTMLNLVGIKDNKGKRFGKDLFNSKEGFVANQYYVPIGSFIDDEKVFEMSKDGIFENSKAWDRKTKEPIDIEECREGYERAISELKESKIILDNDLIDDIIGEQKKNQDN
ncbi:LTA synthase family protein [Clostridium sp. D2Q-11]|uniref:LTA synthase family protein n=1 Tax=Anaeromonas frigoriresistens TaxID=2683708 RepID=A0A942UW41_9FIRM|nr:LTA synthase family protein [Anaeromonas frigoriresistens]MBS4539145.1 LTA synthase family protein [Anaeromonas frigoriresistens]